MNEHEAPPPTTSPSPPPPQGRGVLRGFLITGGISAGIALVGLVLLTVGIGVVIIMPYALLQLAWTLPMYFSFKRKNQPGEAKGALLACALNIVASVGCWIYVANNLNIK